MTPTDDAPPAGARLPRRTTPTWEMELLLSGATVFALFQAAQEVQALGTHLLPRLAGNWELLVSLLLTYGHGGLLLLVAAFLLHLVLRAYWVALVGMNSVFPGGLDVTRTRAGPLARDLLRRRWVDLDTAIERADNRATIVFALGISIAIVLLPVSLLVALLFGASALLAGIGAIAADPATTARVYLILAALLMAPYFVANWLDRRHGATLVPGSWPHRFCTRTLAAYSRVGMGRDFSPLVTLFTSNVGERRGNAVVIAIMVVALFGSVVGMAMGGNELGLGNYGAFPDPRAGMAASTDGRHYASSQDAGDSPAVPFVPDPVATGPYLRLVVPYVPARHGHLLRDCGAPGQEAVAVAEERRRRQQLRGCLQAGLRITLDGAPVVIAPDWYTQPDRDLRGLLYMIDLRALGPGRHELAVANAADPVLPPARRDSEEAPYVIPFWR